MRARVVIAVAVLLAVGGYAVADAADVAPGVLTLAPTPLAARPTKPPRADPAPIVAGPALDVLSPTALAPTPAGVASVLRPLLRAPALGPRVSSYVVDVGSAQVLFDQDADDAMVPASTTKVLTAAAVLSSVGGSTRLPTRVVQGDSPDEVVLVGGGDMLLAPGRAQASVEGRAGLGDLAEQVAAALAEAGQSRVAVRVDDSLFAGPPAPPSWQPGDLATGYAGRVAALGLATDRARPGRASSADPAMTAAVAFASALAKAGVAVAGRPARTLAPITAQVLGTVESAPVADVLGVALLESDNALAEVMARLTAKAMGRGTSSGDAAMAVLDQLQSLGVDVGSTRLVDGSGLGRGSAVPARVLGQVLLLAAGPDHPALRPLLGGLPVAGFTGTLAERFTAPRTRAAAGSVRAKTGTLTGAAALAGSTVDADGRLLVFVVMADRVPVNATVAARSASDRVGAALAACGCR